MKYTTTATVDAIQYDGDNYEHVVKWCDELTGHTTGAASPPGTLQLFLSLAIDRQGRFEVQQLELTPGHWLIRGITGQFFTCDPERFANTYKPIEETP